MSPAAAPGAPLTEEIRDLGERLRAAAERCGVMSEESGQLSAENRALNARLAAAEEQLSAVEAKNGQLLEDNRDLAERLSKANAEIALLNDAGGDSGVSTRQTSSSCSSGAQDDGAQTTLPFAVLFPDAGQNYLKMMSGVKHLPAVQDMLGKTGAILGFDVGKLCTERPGNQPVERVEKAALAYITGLAGLEKLRSQREEAVTCAQAMAGLGVGEYAALAAAGVFSFEDGMKLVRHRLEVITEVQETGVKQATAWVAGLDKPKLAALCAKVVKKEGGGAVCQVSAECFTRGYSVAGTESTVLAVAKLAEQAGAWQAHVESHAVHTPLMATAQERMNAVLDNLLPRMHPPRTTVYMNATGTPVRPGTDPKEVAEILKRELIHPLLWETSVRGMIEEGVSDFYEVGHGEVLKGFMKRINRKAYSTMTSVVI